MDFHDGAIHHGVFHVWCTRQSFKNPFKNIGFYPITEPFEHRVPFAKMGRKITPRAIRASDLKHSFEKQAGITACAAWIGFLAQTMRLHQRPHLIRDHKTF